MTAIVLSFPPAGTRSARRRHPAVSRAAEWPVDAHGVLDAAEELLARGHAADVVAFCERAVTVLELNASEIVDPAPLVRLAQRLGDLERRACAASGRGVTFTT